MNLLAEKQTYPQFAILLFKARLTANCMFASLITQKGSEPPNSNTLLFKYLLAIDPIIEPAFDDPVKETPCTYLFDNISSN